MSDLMHLLVLTWSNGGGTCASIEFLMQIVNGFFEEGEAVKIISSQQKKRTALGVSPLPAPMRQVVSRAKW
jgi:hypothetical protein